MATNSVKKNEAFRASFNLTSKLYTHALFPRWPKLGSLRAEFARKLKSTGNSFSGQREATQGFFSALSAREVDNSSTISELLNGAFSDALDPVGYTGNLPINESSSITLAEAEEAFSHSIGLGFEYISRYLNGPEKLLFKNLKFAEVFVETPEAFNKSNYQTAKEVHNALKIFAARVVKRSIGVRKGIYQCVDEVELYKKTLNNSIELGKLRRVFEKLINRDSTFQASLITTFGQPEPSAARNAVLKSPLIPVKSLPAINSDGRPRELVPYFRVRNRPVPLTFELFFALHHSSEGLSPASLPEGVFALLDSTKSCVLGEIVRDPELTDQFDIIVGGFDEVIKCDDLSGFYVERIIRG
jgi:hypothetical protein